MGPKGARCPTSCGAGARGGSRRNRGLTPISLSARVLGRAAPAHLHRPRVRDGAKSPVADEAVSALDVSAQAQVLALLEEIRDRLQLTMSFITHDLRVATQVRDRIAVMHSGQVVEQGAVGEVFAHPKHEYTRSLLAAAPGRGWF